MQGGFGAWEQQQGEARQGFGFSLPRYPAMETISPTSSSLSGWHEASTFDELAMQQSLLFSDSLKDLKNLRSQLYSAAEYFELSYSNDDQKQLVVNTLKDYAVKALVNTVDHLGSVSFKVNGLLDEKVDEVSGTELRVSCIEQRIRTCQALIDREGLSQQSLVITAPKYHKQYILPVGGSMPESGRLAVAKSQESKILMDNIELQPVQSAIHPTIRDRAPSFRKLRSISPSPSQRARSSSPARKVRSSSPSPRPAKSFTERRAVSQFTNSNPLARSGSFSSRPSLLSSSSIGRRHPSELQKSATMRLHAERNDYKEIEQNPGKSKSFLKSLLSRRKSRKDEMLYSYLDEY